MAYWMKAAITGWDMQDVMALFHEKKHNPDTAEALDDMFPVFHPTDGGFDWADQFARLSGFSQGQ